MAMDFLKSDTNYRENPKFPHKNENGKYVFYHCKRHDYIYYPEPIETEEGVRYRAGYYDETGKYHKELHIFKENSKEGIICKYCGCRLELAEIEEMEELKCPQCDASFELIPSTISLQNDRVAVMDIRFTDRTDSQARRYIYESENAKMQSEKYGRKRAAYDPNYSMDIDNTYDEEYVPDNEDKLIATLIGIEELQGKNIDKMKDGLNIVLGIFFLVAYILYELIIAD